MKLFEPTKERVTVKIMDGEVYDIHVYWSLLCYPVVIDNIEERWSNPSVVKNTRAVNYAMPNEAQKVWFKMFFSKKKFIERVLIPCLANFIVYELSGEFSNGTSNYE